MPIPAVRKVLTEINLLSPIYDDYGLGPDINDIYTNVFLLDLSSYDPKPSEIFFEVVAHSRSDAEADSQWSICLDLKPDLIPGSKLAFSFDEITMTRKRTGNLVNNLPDNQEIWVKIANETPDKHVGFQLHRAALLIQSST